MVTLRIFLVIFGKYIMINEVSNKIEVVNTKLYRE